MGERRSSKPSLRELASATNRRVETRVTREEGFLYLPLRWSGDEDPRSRADMEGATGVTWPADVLPGTAQWQRCRAMFTSDVNAAVAGFFDGGADEVLINEAHWTMRNLLLEAARRARDDAHRPAQGPHHGRGRAARRRRRHRVPRLPHRRRHRGRARAHLPRQLDHRRLGRRAPGPARATSTPSWSPSTASRWSWSPATTGPARTPRATRPRRGRSRSRTTCPATPRCAVPPARTVADIRAAAQEAVRAGRQRHDARSDGPFMVEVEFDAEHLATATPAGARRGPRRRAPGALHRADDVRDDPHVQGGHRRSSPRGGEALWLIPRRTPRRGRRASPPT